MFGNTKIVYSQQCYFFQSTCHVPPVIAGQIFSWCENNNDCYVADSECRNHSSGHAKCQCLPGLSHDPVTKTCVTSMCTYNFINVNVFQANFEIKGYYFRYNFNFGNFKDQAHLLTCEPVREKGDNMGSDHVQSQKMARDWKFWIYKVEELYSPCTCSENKSAEADLRLCFRQCTLLVFLCGGSCHFSHLMHLTYSEAYSMFGEINITFGPI